MGITMLYLYMHTDILTALYVFRGSMDRDNVECEECPIYHPHARSIRSTHLLNMIDGPCL